MIPFPRIAKPIGIAALLLCATQAWHMYTRPAPPVAKPAKHTAGLPQGGTYLRPWMDQARPYSPAYARLDADPRPLPHDRYHEMVIHWNDGPIDPGTDHLRFTFDVQKVDDARGEAWTGEHRADRHDPQEPCASPTVVAEEVLAHDEVTHPERGLAHLHDSLTLPVPPTTSTTQQESLPDVTPAEALLHHIPTLPYRYRSISYHTWHRQLENWDDMHMMTSMSFPADVPVFKPEWVVAYEQQLFEELYQLHLSIIERAALPATEEPREEDEGDHRRYGIQAAPMPDAPTDGVRTLIQRYADPMADMDPGIFVEAGGADQPRAPEELRIEYRRQLEELQRLVPRIGVQKSEQDGGQGQSSGTKHVPIIPRTP